MRHMLGNLSPNYFERTKRYMMLRASQQGTDLTVSGTPPLSLPNSLGKPLKAWSVDVLPKQDLNGYDAPWPAGCGVNKVDNSAYQNGYIRDNNGELVPSNDSAATDYVPVVGGNTYCIVTQQTAGRWAAWYDADKQYISGFTGYTDKSTVIAPANAAFVRLTVSASNSNPHPELFAFNYPATATTWSPYSNLCPIYGTDKLNLFVEESYDQSATPKAVLTLPQTVYTGAIGSEGGESRWGKIVFNGSESWAIGGANEGFWVQLNTLKKLSDYTDAILCETLKTYAHNSASEYLAANSGITGYKSTVYPNQNWIYAKGGGATTAAEFKAWLAENPITVVYELSTPTTFSVPSPPIPTPTGTATTWATAEYGTVDGMEVTYVGKA